MSRTVGPFIVSFGTEEYFLDRDMLRAYTWKDRHVVRVSGSDLDDGDLVGILESGTIDGSPKVVVVDDAHKIKADKALKAYIANKDATDDHVVVVAIVRAEKCPEIWVQAAKKGKLIEHRAFKTYDSNNEVVKWIDKEARSLGLALPKGMSETLYRLVGYNLYRLSSELQKLLLLADSEGKVTLDHLRLTVAPSPTAEPYEVAESAFMKDRKKALNTLSTVYRAMGDEAHVPIAFSLIRQAEKVLLARSLVDQSKDEEEVAGALGMHPWRYRTHFAPIVQRHKVPDLIRYMRILRKLDLDVKSSARSKRTLVELAVLNIAQ